jgi:hypothetical protein
MKDLYQVLREKELDVMRVRQEVEALRYAVPLLVEEAESTNIGTAASQPPSAHVNIWPLRVDTTLQDGPSRTSLPSVGGERSFQH